MNSRSFTALGVLVVLGLAVAVPAVAVADFGSTAVQEEQTDNESQLGVAVTSFAQSTAVDAQGSAEQGLWQAQANATFERNATENETNELISDRATELEQRLQALQKRSDRLTQNRANLSEAAYNARASALRSQIANVRSAIDQANQTAVSRGVNVTQLDRLRNNAANLTGPEVAAIARNITDAPRGPPEGVPGQNSERPRGPPSERGPQSQGNDSANRPSGAENGTSGNPGMGAQNGSAGPNDPGAGGTNDSEAGQPDAAGDSANAGGSANASGPQSDDQTTTSDSADDDSTADDESGGPGKSENRGR
jgi:hypothetical protein